MESVSIPARFAEQVGRAPDAVAVSAGSTTLSFRELDERANRLAHRLVGVGIRQEDRVAVLMSRSIELVVATLAILKAGGCYVPVHEDYPDDWKQRVVEQSGAVVLLADAAKRAKGLPTGVPTIIVDDDPSIVGQPVVDPAVPIHPDQLAYVIHTSGSTGIPKGVAVTQRDVVRLILDPQWVPERHVRVLMVAPYAFSVSTYEIWMPLLHGGRIVIAPPGHLAPDALRRLITEERITGIHLTAGLFRVLAEEVPETFVGLDEVLTGGDMIAPHVVRRVLDTCPGIVIRAMYGLTESSVFIAHHPLTTEYRPGVLVPFTELTDVTIRILDQSLAPVPAGSEGEIYISGRGVARGYFGRTDLTAERFVADPFGEPGTRMYRTGDLARRDDDGFLELVGRTISQVKILGFRIELAEVEAALARYPGLKHVVVVARELKSGEMGLAGYVVPESDELDVRALRAFARETLPEYMVPSAFVRLDSLPLTRNGKVDRSALPEAGFDADSTYRPPETPRQDSLCAIFGAVLEAPAVGIDDSFFDLGGQSLQAMRLISRIKAELGVDLPINVLFDVPTVAGLAKLIDSEAAPAA